MGGGGGSFCGLPLPLLVAAIVRAPANYRVVHLVIFTKVLKEDSFEPGADVYIWSISHLGQQQLATVEGQMNIRHFFSPGVQFKEQNTVLHAPTSNRLRLLCTAGNTSIVLVQSGVVSFL